GENTIDIIQKPKDCERVVSRQVNRVTSTFNLKNDLSDSDDYLESSLSILENNQAKGVANSREITPTITPNKPLIIEPNVTNIYGILEGETTLINTPAKTNNNQIIHSIPQINHRRPINLKSVLKSMTYTNGQGNIPNIYIQEAQKYYEQGLYEKAISQCQQAISLEIDAVAAYIILGKSMEKVGQIKQAESNYQTALKIQPNNASIYRLLGNLYVEYQSGSLAIYCYQKAVEIEPKVADNYRQLALVWAELGEAKAAIDCWSQADSLESKEVTANDHFNLGNKLYEKGRITQAVFCYQNSIELNPNLGSVYYNLSVALRCLGRLDEAVTYYHKAREIWAYKNQNQDNLKVDINSSISANLEVKYQNGHQLNAAEIKREIWVEKNQNQNNLKVD
ncbi:MAG: tetratricopeptide repeat protein, partial [Trichodesmium sp. St18_bin1]|nr:tetratricopeptide repeat protein [Trichodesmium sp. St18_bin1]